MQSEKQKAGTPPSYKGEGVAIWVNKDKNNQTYLSVQLFGSKGIKINAFKYEPKLQSSNEEIII